MRPCVAHSFWNDNLLLEMKKGTLALFDFDGTLTTKDSFIEFAVHAAGRRALLLGIIRNLPWLVAWKLKILNGGEAKQRLFSTLFKGMPYADFRRHCSKFADRIKGFERVELIEKLQSHINRKDQIFIVSASISEWIKPWASDHAIMENNVIGTEIEIDDTGRLTGKFATPNCNGEEKVRRLKKTITNLSSFEIFAYGDSSGDSQMLAIADHQEQVLRQSIFDKFFNR